MNRQLDPFDRVWRLNLTKSKYNPPTMAPQGETYNMKVEDNTLKGLTETTLADGQVRRYESAVILDGEENPFSPAFFADTIMSKRVDLHTISYVFAKAGKEIEHAWSAISVDGKTLTSTRKRMNEQGEELTTIAVYDKQ